MNRLEIPPGDALDTAPLILASAPWSDAFPYRPEVAVRTGWTPSVLTLRFTVRETTIRAHETDPLLVHRDSCVEFFFRLPGDSSYFNLESNPRGVFLFARGPDRHRREDLTDAVRDLIGREGSLTGEEPFDEREADRAWVLTLRLPARTVPGITAWGPHLAGMTANLYKCGDALSRPHYQTWRPPPTAEPDFHQPDGFGPVVFLAS